MILLNLLSFPLGFLSVQSYCLQILQVVFLCFYLLLSYYIISWLYFYYIVINFGNIVKCFYYLCWYLLYSIFSLYLVIQWIIMIYYWILNQPSWDKLFWISDIILFAYARFHLVIFWKELYIWDCICLWCFSQMLEQVYVEFIKHFVEIHSFSKLWMISCKVTVIFSHKVWYNSPLKLSKPEVLFLRVNYTLFITFFVCLVDFPLCSVLLSLLAPLSSAVPS